MNWLMFAIGAALSWGLYGPFIHKGQVALGNPMRALLCVGVAYLLGAFTDFGSTRMHHSGDDSGNAWRVRCHLRHLGLSRRRRPDLCYADRLRIRAARERAVYDVRAPAPGGSQSSALCRFPADRDGSRHGVVLQATELVPWNVMSRIIPGRGIPAGGVAPFSVLSLPCQPCPASRSRTGACHLSGTAARRSRLSS